ncbi:hypothetical protein [Streptococcus uberis]
MKNYSKIKISNNLIEKIFTFFVMFILLFSKGMIQSSIMIFVFILYIAYTKKIIILGNKKYIFVILFLALYSILVVFFNSTNDVNLIFRYLRCLISYFLLSQMFYKSRLDNNEFIKLILFLLFIHSISILISIILPSSREIFEHFSGYDKKFLRWRASGLVSGFDFAGILTNIGLILTVYLRNLNKKSLFGISGLIFILATLFTSRTSMIVLLIELLLIFIYLIGNKQYKKSLVILIPMILLVSVSLFFLILTTDIGAQYREYILSKSNFARKFYKVIFLTYSNSAYSKAIIDHFYIEPNVNIWFGSGYKPIFRDPGYTNTIYRIGIFGTILEIYFYFSMLFESLKIYIIFKKINSVINTYASQLIIIILITIFMQSKLIFFFSSTIFEITLILYFLLLRERTEFNNEKIKN